MTSPFEASEVAAAPRQRLRACRGLGATGGGADCCGCDDALRLPPLPAAPLILGGEAKEGAN